MDAKRIGILLALATAGKLVVATPIESASVGAVSTASYASPLPSLTFYRLSIPMFFFSSSPTPSPTAQILRPAGLAVLISLDLVYA